MKQWSQPQTEYGKLCMRTKKCCQHGSGKEVRRSGGRSTLFPNTSPRKDDCHRNLPRHICLYTLYMFCILSMAYSRF